MQDWQQRVVDEESALSDRITKLTAFLKTDTFAAMEREDRGLMEAQLMYMQNYDIALQKRIERFKA